MPDSPALLHMHTHTRTHTRTCTDMDKRYEHGIAAWTWKLISTLDAGMPMREQWWLMGAVVAHGSSGGSWEQWWLMGAVKAHWEQWWLISSDTRL
jgi:hypothetical protein